jgi:hypothetical protein
VRVVKKAGPNQVRPVSPITRLIRPHQILTLRHPSIHPIVCSENSRAGRKQPSGIIPVVRVDLRYSKLCYIDTPGVALSMVLRCRSEKTLVVVWALFYYVVIVFGLLRQRSHRFLALGLRSHRCLADLLPVVCLMLSI